MNTFTVNDSGVTKVERCAYFDNLLDAAIYSLKGIYDEEYIRKNYTSPTSKFRKILKNLQEKGFILKDKTINKYIAFPYEVYRVYQFETPNDQKLNNLVHKFTIQRPGTIPAAPSVAPLPYIPDVNPISTNPYYYPINPTYPIVTCSVSNTEGMEPNARFNLTTSAINNAGGNIDAKINA